MKLRVLTFSLLTTLSTPTFAAKPAAKKQPAKKATAEVLQLRVDTTKSYVDWEGRKVTGSKHDGKVQLKSGKITIDTEKNLPAKGEFIIDMNSISNNDLKSDPKSQKKLVDHLKSDDFFDVKKHPTAKFDLKSAKTAKNGLLVSGDLTIRGKTNPLSFTAQWNKLKNNAYELAASFDIDRLKYGIQYNSKSFFPKLAHKYIIEDDVGFKVHIVTAAVK